MSLFGSPPASHSGEEPALTSSTTRQQPQKGVGTRGGLFDEPPSSASPNGLFDETVGSGNGGGSTSTSQGAEAASSSPSPWDMPTPRKPHRRLDMMRSLLPADVVPVSYIDTFDTVVREDGDAGGRVTAGGVAKLFATARLEPETQARIMALITADGGSDDVSLARSEFHVLLALIGLAQEGEVIGLDGVDERRRNLPEPKLAGLTAEPVLAPVAELVAAKPPQTPTDARRQARTHAGPETETQPSLLRPSMDDPEDDPWNSPEMHKAHAHLKTDNFDGTRAAGGRRDNPDKYLTSTTASRTLMEGFAADSTAADSSQPAKLSGGTGGEEGGVWDLLRDANPAAASGAAGFRNGGGAAAAAAAAAGGTAPGSHPFGSDGGVDRSLLAAAASTARGFPSGRTGHSVEENIIVSLIPEKEGLFMFQHHNYEVTSHRRGSKVVRRYSDFVWLLDCLHKRYPFRALPLLPPKRVALNGNHLSNDGAFIEKRRRGLTRFLNALARHPVLSQEQLVVMFLTVPTELNVWRKQATISVQDELAERALPPGLEDSLPPVFEELFSRTRAGVSRSAELYITVCNVMDRLVKRSEGVAADHARIALSLTSLTESSVDAYATDTNEVPLLNDGLVAMSKHLRACQTLMEDESRVWDEGVLEDLKQQRDALVSVRQMFERRERMDKDGIPHLERRIQANETRLASLRSKPEGMVKPGEIERVAESIIKDKEAIVRQHNRSIFIRECLRDELVTFQRTQYHVSRWNQDWAGERVKYAEMLADNWRRLLDELEGMPLGD